MPECAADEVHYPGTYVAGCCNRLTSNVAGRQVENEDMANVPNWLPLRFRLHEEQWLTPGTATVLDHHQILHLDSGLLERRTRYGLGAGRALAVRQQRLVHMADPHLAALRTEFTAEGFAGELEVEATPGGDVTNAGVPRCRDLDGRHLTHVHTGTDTADTVWLRCRTRTSDIRIAMASRLTADEPATVRHDGPRVSPSTRLLLTPGRTVTVDKTVALHTSRDPAISDPLQAALAGWAGRPTSTNCSTHGCCCLPGGRVPSSPMVLMRGARRTTEVFLSPAMSTRSCRLRSRRSQDPRPPWSRQPPFCVAVLE